MAMNIGDESATSGMTKDIYDKLNELLSPNIKDDPPGTLAKAQTSWKQLAFAIATGVVTHIKNNAQVSGVKVTGNANLAVTGTISGSNVSGTAKGALESQQSGPTTGLVS